jgi:hypothetical protein
MSRLGCERGSPDSSASAGALLSPVTIVPVTLRGGSEGEMTMNPQAEANDE